MSLLNSAQALLSDSFTACYLPSRKENMFLKLIKMWYLCPTRVKKKTIQFKKQTTKEW